MAKVRQGVTFVEEGVQLRHGASASEHDGGCHSVPSGAAKERRASEIHRTFNPTAFVPARVNAEISKRYDIAQNEIGSGGYGKVFVARDKEIKDRIVAIKKVIIFDEEKKKAFKREAHIMKELDHPNICKLLETYEQGRHMFFVMELCEGREVFDRIMEFGMIDEQTTADIVRQCASALKYAHNRGIAHRDMKPENICFCTNNPEDHHVKVIDWGLGFYFGQARMNSAVGSLTYAAPEVLEARELDGYTCACDLWSLGVVTYVMLCGKPPFWGNYNEQLRRMKKETFPMADSLWQATSREAKELIKGLLKCKPEHRLSLDAVLSHPWLRGRAKQTDPAVSQQVLTNLRQFSNTSHFFSICVASVARQLDHKGLVDVHRVFCEMDTNGDGVLELHEVKHGFEKIFGKDSEQLKDVERMFARLDLDGSGTIDYTEFCAAGIGERMSTEEHVLRAAFKAFDVQDDDGQITKDEIMQVLSSADVNKVWTKEVCESVAQDIMERFDQNGDGTLDFEEWLVLMRDCAHRHQETEPPEGAGHDRERELLAEINRTGRRVASNFKETYTLLTELDEARRKSFGARTPTSGSKKPTFALEADSSEGSRISPVANPSPVHGFASGLFRSFSSRVARTTGTPACFMCSGYGENRNGQCSVM